jgi:NDP-sugar pyrophosphorylase family protein
MSHHAVVLAGGQGSRLLPYRTIVPKPLLPVGDRSVLDLVLSQLARHGFTDACLAVGDLDNLVRAMFGDGARHGLRLRCCPDHEALGGAGLLAELELDAPFLVMDGNVLTDLDLRALSDAHEEAGHAVTMAVRQHQVEVDFGVLGVQDGVVTSYRERPVAAYTVSMGVYAMQPHVRRYVEPGERLGLAELIGRLLAAGERVGAYGYEGPWLDVRRREDYERALERAAAPAPDPADWTDAPVAA